MSQYTVYLKRVIYLDLVKTHKKPFHLLNRILCVCLHWLKLWTSQWPYWTGTIDFPAVYLLLFLQHMWLYYKPSYKFSQAAKQQCECDPSLLLYRGDLCTCFWTYAQCLVWNIKPSHSLSLCVSVRLKPLDIEFMKRLHEKVNIIPLIAKADTLTPEECQQFKKQVRVIGC